MQRVFFLIAISLLGYSGYACDCEPSRMTVGLYNELTAVFDGKVVSRVTKDYSIIYTIKVNHWYKGSNGTDTVQLSTASTTGACGLIKLNDTSTYLIYAWKTKQGLESSWCTSLVDISTWLPYNYHEDTVLLNQLIPRTYKEGAQLFYDKDGKLAASGRYLNGKPVGLWKYYRYGKPYQSGRYSSQGLRDSIWNEYNLETGKLEYQYEFSNGRYTTWNKYYDEGKISRESYPVPGTDKWISKGYHDNGRIRFSSELTPPREQEDGRLRKGWYNGLSKEYYENGRLKEIGAYYKHYPTGIWKFYDERGKLVQTKIEKSKEEIDKMPEWP